MPVNCHGEPAPKSGGNAAVVAIKLPPTLIMELGPKYRPFAFARITVPFAFRFPYIRDGLASPISLKTMELDDGWRNEVVWPAPMLKLCQFKMANWLTVILSCEPICWAMALPAVTVSPVGLANVSATDPARNDSAAKEIHWRASMNFLGQSWLGFMARLELVANAEV